MNSRRARHLPFALLAIALAAAARADDQIPSPTAPAPPSLKATLKLPTVAVIGDHIRGEFIVQNTGSEPVKIRAGENSATLRPRAADGSVPPLNFSPVEASIDPWLRVRVWTGRGKLLPDLVGSPLYAMPARGSIVTLAPGASRSIYCPLESYAPIVLPGVYTISVWNDLGWLADDAHPPLMATVEVEFKLPNAGYVATRVRSLCAKDTDENTWELMHLWSPLFLPALRDEAKAGRAPACLGLSGVLSEDANQALLDLASSRDATVARAALYALTMRLPSLINPEQPALRSWSGSASRAQILHYWQPKFDAPLMAAATRLLESPPPLAKAPAKTDSANPGSLTRVAPNPVAVAAQIIGARGSLDQVPALLHATQRALDTNLEPRKGPQAPVAPPPLDALIRALDTLRARGWRTDGQGGAAATLAWFRQLADPRLPMPADTAWQDAVRAALGARSPILRENAVRAMPLPLTDAWEPLLRTALEDEDTGVLCAACTAAGRSGRKSLRGLLVNIIVNAQQPEAQTAAAEAAVRLGGGVEVWTALCEVIPQPAMMATALVDLVRGTMETPPGGFMADNKLTPEQAAAVRDAWKTFLERNRELLESGQRVPTGDPSITPTMMLAVRLVPVRQD